MYKRGGGRNTNDVISFYTASSQTNRVMKRLPKNQFGFSWVENKIKFLILVYSLLQANFPEQK